MYTIPLEVRMLTRASPEPNSGCWLWTGGVTKPRRGTPYGMIRVGGRNGKGRLAHRVAFELWCRRIEPGEVIRHTCDNTYCINPAHLVAGSQADNIKDRDQRKRRAPPKGEKNGCARLTDVSVLEIKAQLKAGIPRLEIQARFGIEKSQLSNISRGTSWGHVT